MGPAPSASQNRATAETPVEGALPVPPNSATLPLFYLLGLGLLTATGAVAFHLRRRARDQAAPPAHPEGVPPQLPRQTESEPPDFLDEIQRREQHLEDSADQLHADAIDVEVIDLGPTEDVD